MADIPPTVKNKVLRNILSRSYGQTLQNDASNIEPLNAIFVT